MTRDAIADRFFTELRGRRLMTTRCRACGSLRFPPRAWCPDCLSEDLEWVELSGRGRLAAFSTQETAIRFRAPDVIGLVDLDDGVRVLSHIAGRYEDLSIGDAVSVDFVEVEPGLVLHSFMPDASSS
jgi:uncharacterized OB-fold protein